MALIVEPDVELICTGMVRAFLDSRPEPFAQDVHVDRRRPAEMPDWVVTVRDDGGRRLDVARWQVRIGINVYGPNNGTSFDDTKTLAILINAGLFDAAIGAPVIKVFNQTTPVSVPEPDDRPHVYSSAELIIYGSEIT